MPPTRIVFWSNCVNTIRMPPVPFPPPPGRSWKNSGTLTSLTLIPSCRIAILVSALPQGFLQTCSVPSSFLLSSRSLPIQNGLPTSGKTIFTPSFPALLSAILREPVLSTISRPASGFLMMPASRPKFILQRKNHRNQRKRGGGSSCRKAHRQGSF